MSEIKNFVRSIELLATPTILLDEKLCLYYANPAAEDLFDISTNQSRFKSIERLFLEPNTLISSIENAVKHQTRIVEHSLELVSYFRLSLFVSVFISPIMIDEKPYISLEFRSNDSQLKLAREERIELQQEVNRELIRKLAHEVRNPLGGMKGAAQLLELELKDPNLLEYTQVIIHEIQRLQSLLDRMLFNKKPVQFQQCNIHELLERVKNLIKAEFVQQFDFVIERDYDISLPSIKIDREQMMQVILNIARNAIQILFENYQNLQQKRPNYMPKITFRTRIFRHLTLLRKHHKLGVKIEIIDNGPGIPKEIKEKIFFPLVSGREQGTGLGLTIAQNYVHQHQGVIECESIESQTIFKIFLPII